MKAVWGECPELPAPITDAVWAYARKLGRTVASDDLFLLALTRLDKAQAARRVLAAEGIDFERLLDAIRTSGDQALDHPGSLTFSPASYVMRGRAQGFAAALGNGTINSEHVLLAVLWDPTSHSSGLLWRLGVGRERILNRLGDIGGPVPAASPPSQWEIELGDKVWFERHDVSRVIGHLRLHIPPTTQWGYNYEGDRAWAYAEANVDVQALVRAAVAA